MVNLIRYEFIRKWRTLCIFLAVVMVLNIAVLIKLQTSSVPAEQQMFILGGFFGGMLTLFFAMFIIEVTHMYQMDINRKSGYMLFLTPNSGYKLLGSKVLTGILEGLLFLIIFSLLTFINFYGIYGEPFTKLIASSSFQMVVDHLNLRGINVIPFLVMNLLTMFIIIITLILTIFTAISLRKSILAEKKYGGLLSLIIFFVLVWLNGKINETVFVLGAKAGIMVNDATSYMNMGTVMVIQIILGIIMFMASAYLLDRKMDF